MFPIYWHFIDQMLLLSLWGFFFFNFDTWYILVYLFLSRRIPLVHKNQTLKVVMGDPICLLIRCGWLNLCSICYHEHSNKSMCVCIKFVNSLLTLYRGVFYICVYQVKKLNDFVIFMFSSANLSLTLSLSPQIIMWRKLLDVCCNNDILVKRPELPVLDIRPDRFMSSSC